MDIYKTSHNREEIVYDRKKRSDENTIFVGNKPPMSYVLAVVTQFNGGSDIVQIKARGRAVDTAEIVRNRFVTDATVKDIKISTENMTNEEGRTSNVSSIEITLSTK
ncbi:MAG: DNA-binding protein Alba [Candidatus Thermoplasmatota archaeon]|nr:DNA-binding protein Alba [Candidatus Thermoplasmatota archaeon]